MSVFGCSPIHKCNSTDKGINTNNFGQIYQQQVGEFPVIPTNILENLDKMGIDNSSILNDYEIEYLRFIFKIDAGDFNLVGKKVGFLRSKKDYFEQTRERFYRNSTLVGCSILYIFDAIQKEASGGYDAVIVYWSKFLLPTEDIVKRAQKYLHKYYNDLTFRDIPENILESIDKMGLDNRSLLTELEGKYFNTLYQIPEKEFNLSDKKVAFITGRRGRKKSSKEKYFKLEKERLNCNKTPNSGILYIFNATQKEENGGYDAAIVYWSKTVFTIEDVVKRLKEKH